MPPCASASRVRWSSGCDDDSAAAGCLVNEWWTYRPSDFLMFAPRIYWRLFESINEAFWPWQLLIAAAVLMWAWRGQRWWRASGVVLSAMFVLVAWAFLHHRLAPIFWVAEFCAWAFAAQALLLIVLMASSGARSHEPSRTVMVVAMALGLWAVVGHPLLAPIASRPWSQAEWPGLAPDPTAILAMAWLLRMPGATTGWLRVLKRAAWVVPVAWCVFSAATLATMGEWQALVMLAAPSLVVLAMKKGRSGNPLRP